VHCPDAEEALATALTVAWSMPVAAQTKDANAEFEKFRAEMEESNPAELFELKGEDLVEGQARPEECSLAESCDLGQGVGKVEGAWVKMPRYFADADAVMDGERRIVWCMTEKQGFKFADIAKKPFQGANDNNAPDITNLVTYVASGSRNMKFDMPCTTQGARCLRNRQGHGRLSRRSLRFFLQHLPRCRRQAHSHAEPAQSSTPEGAMRGVQGWPGYRMTGGVMLTSQWRMNDCFRQQRFPEPKYASQAVTNLIAYMTGNANGQMYKGPGIKR
jgi:sulfur-oxidizing protein SoxA